MMARVHGDCVMRVREIVRLGSGSVLRAEEVIPTKTPEPALDAVDDSSTRTRGS
jgi:hypothetical protein